MLYTQIAQAIQEHLSSSNPDIHAIADLFSQSVEFLEQRPLPSARALHEKLLAIAVLKFPEFKIPRFSVSGKVDLAGTSINGGKDSLPENSTIEEIPQSLQQVLNHDSESSLDVLSVPSQHQFAANNPCSETFQDKSLFVHSSQQLGDLPIKNVLFFLSNSMDSASGCQVQQLIRILQSRNNRCLISTPGSPPLAMVNGQVKEHVRTDYIFDNGRGPDVIHAWTPKEIVRQNVEQLLAQYSCPLVVHLNGNEEYLTAIALGMSLAELKSMSMQNLDKLVPEHCYHPLRGRSFLNQAQGMSVAIETLNRYNLNNVPYQFIPPMVVDQLFYPRPLNKELRHKHAITDDTTVLVYSGCVRKHNLSEVRELYKAVTMLNEQGRPTVLLRTGLDSETINVENSHEIHLGWVNREDLPGIMAAADVFVQPGKPGPFSDEHIPGSLPEFFAIGRPVILPLTNLGLQVKHGLEGYVLEQADAPLIVKAIMETIADQELAGKLSEGAIDFYLKLRDKFIHNTTLLYKKL